ncbi:MULTISPECIES: TetR/AcrR family transcriptional regulator [unclassified Nocardioides]|uniref:TetR/AcrR family transcriptional regulator n=1 Tax=unclassified Nocardioides TaxID=2615069 RepID=UPI000312D341|nr:MULTISPECIES: TetR/AcrR family transcriptional regulator [unclassified Nocardioides]
MSGQRPPGDGRGSPERILDAAAELFAGRGVGGVGMGEIARAARCSRATLYRYFPDRHALHLAFVHREARRVGATVAAETAGLADPPERLAAAVLASVRLVREAPALLAWFGAADAATTAELAQSSAVVEALGRGLVDDEDAARWLVRVIVSLLTVPGRDDHDERALVERFVVPAVATTPW